MAVTGWDPTASDAGAPTDTVVKAVFSDYPDPDTVGLSSMSLTTGVYRVPEAYRVDLAAKAVVMTPDSLLTPLLGYAANVSPGLTSLAGCGVTFTQNRFSTGDGAANLPVPPVPTSADVQAIFSASCTAGCHADPTGGCLAAPAGGLSLCASEARAALVDVPAREVSSLARVAPRDSARSYLLRKLLPATVGGGPIPGTLGQREPPGDPLSPDQLETIAAWIDGGALL
ncbi:MAG TPA: Ig-like domain-containing protein [Polyangia bacterium]|nr:Ig-like domain-containing protein [Polyangia bacterium]